MGEILHKKFLENWTDTHTQTHPRTTRNPHLPIHDKSMILPGQKPEHNINQKLDKYSLHFPIPATQKWALTSVKWIMSAILHLITRPILFR